MFSHQSRGKAQFSGALWSGQVVKLKGKKVKILDFVAKHATKVVWLYSGLKSSV